MNNHRTLVRRACGLALPVVVVLTAALAGAWAIDGRDFAGIYEPTNEVESGEYVWMTFTTEFVNYSGADIVGATVRLEDRLDPESPDATFTAIDIVANDRVRLAQEIEVPIRERDAWLAGRTPHLTVEYVDGEGNTVRRHVELMRDVLVEEVEP